MERTFCMLKPGILQRRIVGRIVSRIEHKGLKICAMKMMRIPRAQCERHYSEHKERPFFKSLVDYMTSGPVVAMVVEGQDAIRYLRQLCGATNPAEAAPGTIRGDFALVTQNNIIHASDGPESARREIELFFTADEILEYEDGNRSWLG
ncbi:MAG: nucleoside-diphosphate kinase [Spirochaetaceae bacterium]|nr:MAG: nucleoside-diphosphate kinase [Spirochaetaceae bacterium]